ncbi:MAG TPA: FKBP-type peptidyl-prolyl cis-trans isomerase [Planctomycetota bacterium]|jgi:FKBP-type peptidyl-prolyl cis-trans isomerase|nr:FKBP-type peptidyl-prolyl cis-trans isomerase [Planctomycetota bacterium]OQC19762.1 MAG: FKBP-type 22 kDa peptidyl-prolyl cis-trans isomerase [Planctomycetes bacterium ADurb.Bin069]HNR97734.1 FKBP-type peptidyl-prolyl cis-trans isomerase [Planctomycetota bacterium]HNU24799.1 FKBP-type peptidyl-prolyl cis-trans isomerase [Planctomycetota bacterium]HOE30903.1 FKBP-type peptidyl-prolyl cis-trans isomerase [Planctomycetota bacterium]
MKNWSVALCAAAVMWLGAWGADEVKPRIVPAEPEAPALPPEFADEAARVSYALGLDIGNYLKRLEGDLELKLEPEMFLRAVKEALAGATPALTPEQLSAVKTAAEAKMRAKRERDRAEQEEQRKVQGAKNKQEGELFLAENGKREGVRTTASGLQYQVLREGTGAKPAATDRVKVDYRGTLLDGTEFDSSYARGRPAEFALNGVIKGWTEGLQLMPAGSKYKFFIPAALAYGERGSGQRIGPNATLVFEVELLEILGPPAAKKVQPPLFGPQPPPPK